MRILIAGLGSIGRRHANTIARLRPDASFVFLRRECRRDELSDALAAEVVVDLDAALRLPIDLAVVATPSSRHIDLLPRLIAENIPLYVEKPIVTSREDAEAVRTALAGAHRVPRMAGFNMRWLPSLRKARDLLRGGRLGTVVRASFACGLWLPYWRPSEDYRMGYGARRELGGGVDLDLVHEIDMARWFFGDFEDVTGRRGRFGSLEIETPDVASFLLARAGGPLVSVAIDYIARRRIRRYEMVGDLATMVWDYGTSRLTVDDGETCTEIDCGSEGFDMQIAYRDAMTALLDAIARPEDGYDFPDLIDGMTSGDLALSTIPVERTEEMADLERIR